MELTLKQEQALKEALLRYKNHEKYITISGYAGSGKSTTVRFIIEALDVAEDKVAYASYCGKAAEVLRKKGNKNAMTLHKLLYDSFPKPGGGFYRRPKKFLDYTVIVVDEVSLVPKSMIDMLLRHNVFCIFIGDGFQLLQINKEESHDLLEHPHVFLDEIMRQAQESEIIRLTMKIREGLSINFTRTGEEVLVLPKKELSTGHLLWADEIITATNATRHSLNNQVRKLLGYEGLLCEGEKVLCKRNYWEDCNESGDALVNGSIGIINNIYENFIQIPGYIKNDRHRIPTFSADFIPEAGEPFTNISLDKDFLSTENACVDWRVAYKLGQLRNKIGDILPKQFTYGYCLTAHSAQGSEWDKILVKEESFPYDRETHARWLYTSCTRSASKLVLVRD